MTFFLTEESRLLEWLKSPGLGHDKERTTRTGSLFRIYMYIIYSRAARYIKPCYIIVTIYVFLLLLRILLEALKKKGFFCNLIIAFFFKLIMGHGCQLLRQTIVNIRMSGRDWRTTIARFLRRNVASSVNSSCFC